MGTFRSALLHPTTLRHAFAIAAIACAIRVAYVLAYPQVGPLCPDCGVYDRVASNFVNGKGLVDGTSSGAAGAPAVPEVGIGPVYSTFLAGVYWVAGHRFVAVRMAQAVVGALMVPVMWQISAMAFGSAAARVCAWLVAVSPPLVTYTGMLLTENLSVALLVCSVWLLLVAVNRQRTGWFLAGGVLLGSLILLREEMSLLLPAFGIVAVWKGRPRPSPAQILAYVLAAALCVGVWTVRNYVIFHQPILVSAHGGETLWISAKGWSEWHFDDPAFQDLVRGRDYIARNEVLQHDAIRMIADAPARYLALCLKRIPELWVSSHTSYVRGLSDRYQSHWQRGAYGRLAVKVALLTFNVVMLGLAVRGLVMAFGLLPFAGWLMALPIGIVTIVHFFLFSTPRYQIPVLPFVLAFAAVALARALQGRALPRLGRPVRDAA